MLAGLQEEVFDPLFIYGADIAGSAGTSWIDADAALQALDGLVGPRLKGYQLSAGDLGGVTGLATGRVHRTRGGRGPVVPGTAVTETTADRAYAALTSDPQLANWHLQARASGVGGGYRLTARWLVSWGMGFGFRCVRRPVKQ